MSACIVVDWSVSMYMYPALPCCEKMQCRRGYQLYCRKGILDQTFPSDELTSLYNDRSIALDAWCQTSRVPFKSVINDSSCTEVCKSAEDVIALTSSDEMSTGITMWGHNAVYSLTNDDKEVILSPCGWQ